jgi:dipeptidyl aminopeptidase/acylaminoacyl peptidase
MRYVLASALVLSLCLAAPAADADKAYNATKGMLSGLALSADGRLLAVASDVREKTTIDGRVLDAIKGGELTVWDTRGVKKVFTAPLKSNTVGSMCFTADGSRLAVAQSAFVYVFDAATGKEERAIRTRHYHQTTVAFSPDGKTLVAVSGNVATMKGAIQILDAATGEEKHALNYGDARLTSATLSADGKRLFAVRQTFMGRRPLTAELVVWEVDELKEVRTIEEKAARIAAPTPDGKTIVALVNIAPGSFEFRAYDVATGKQTWKSQPSYATGIVFPAAGDAFYTFPDGARYEVGKDGRPGKSPTTGLKGGLKDLVISADGTTLAVGGGEANDQREARVIRLPKSK